MAGTLTLPLLRIVHVRSGAIWVGAVDFLSVFLIPSIRAAGPAGGPVMEQLRPWARRMAVARYVP